MFDRTMFDRIVGVFLLCLFGFSLPLLSGCTSKSSAAGQAGSGALKPPEVIVDSVAQEDVQIYMYTNGLTVPSNSVDIRARVSGYLEELSFEPGAIVNTGERLALIEQDAYKIALDTAKAELASCKAQAALAEANLVRQKALFDRGVGTAEEVQTQQASYDVALAAIERVNANIRKAELDLQYTTMSAPITGKTTKYLVDAGNFVSPTGAQAVLLSITQLDPMFVEFTLSDRQFIELKDRLGFREAFSEAVNTEGEGAGGEGRSAEDATKRPVALTGMPVDVSLMTGVNVFKFDYNIPGKVVALVDNQINYGTASITLRAEVKNPLIKTAGVEDYMIYAGQVCRVRIPYEEVKDAILIREEAILTDLDEKYVLIVSKEMYHPTDPTGKPLLDENGQEKPAYETDVVSRREIKLGRLLDTQKRIVLEGLKPGESYIVQGLQRARVGSEIQPTTLEDYNARRAAERERVR
jgi:RND family efflux transporter MFP subunit